VRTSGGKGANSLLTHPPFPPWNFVREKMRPNRRISVYPLFISTSKAGEGWGKRKEGPKVRQSTTSYYYSESEGEKRSESAKLSARTGNIGKGKRKGDSRKKRKKKQERPVIHTQGERIERKLRRNESCYLALPFALHELGWSGKKRLRKNGGEITL